MAKQKYIHVQGELVSAPDIQEWGGNIFSRLERVTTMLFQVVQSFLPKSHGSQLAKEQT